MVPVGAESVSTTEEEDDEQVVDIRAGRGWENFSKEIVQPPPARGQRTMEEYSDSCNCSLKTQNNIDL